MVIRTISVDDAENFLSLTEKIVGETDFMLFEEGESEITIEQQTSMIKSFLESENSTILVAEESRGLIGYIMAIGGRAKRNKHSVSIVIGVLQQYAGQGIGKKLFASLEEWARKNEINRLELTTMVHNERARSLYENMGFEIEGVKKRSLMINQTPIDEYYMAKILV
jgi:GNAT superfamily N-acetyltransferase